jgi:hypothetical protein
MRTTRIATTIAAAVAVIILILGAGYLATRSTTYQSAATLLLAPTTTDPDILPGVLESFTRSGTANTYVELIGSRDTLRAAGSPPVEVTVRAVPDSRAIQVTASGDENQVRPGLEALITAARRRENELRDVWALQILERPGAPESTGASAVYVVLATIILALLGAGIVLVSLRRFGAGTASEPPVVEPRDDRPARSVQAYESRATR